MKKYSYTALASMVSMSMTLIACQSVTHASDIEIYSNSTNGKQRLHSCWILREMSLDHQMMLVLVISQVVLLGW